MNSFSSICSSSVWSSTKLGSWETFSSGSFLGIPIIRHWSSIIEAYIVVVIVELSEGLVDWKLQNAWIHSFKHESCVDFLKKDFKKMFGVEPTHGPNPSVKTEEKKFLFFQLHIHLTYDEKLNKKKANNDPPKTEIVFSSSLHLSLFLNF